MPCLHCDVGCTAIAIAIAVAIAIAIADCRGPSGLSAINASGGNNDRPNADGGGRRW